MPGENTSVESPRSGDQQDDISTHLRDENLIVTLPDKLTAAIPLRFLYRLNAEYPIGDDAELLVLLRYPEIAQVFVSHAALTVYLKDGRVITAPLSWYPRLALGTPAERNNYQITGDDQAIHWPDLDEDIDIEVLLVGGPSAESETSLRRWLKSRQSDPAQPRPETSS